MDVKTQWLKLSKEHLTTCAEEKLHIPSNVVKKLMISCHRNTDTECTRPKSSSARVTALHFKAFSVYQSVCLLVRLSVCLPAVLLCLGDGCKVAARAAGVSA